MGRLLKFYEDVQGIDLYPIVTLCIFMAFFSIMTWWAIKAKSKDLDVLAQMPLEDNKDNDAS